MNSPSGPRQTVLHPLFLVRLSHLISTGRTEQAIDEAGREIRIALESDGTQDTDDGGDGGILLVPSPNRANEIGLTDETQPSQMNGIKP